jgi:hypothetical protein
MMLSTKIEETYFSPPYCNVFMHRNCELLLMDFYSSELMQDCSRETEPFSLSLNIALAFFAYSLSIPPNKISIANQSKRKWRDGRWYVH